MWIHVREISFYFSNIVAKSCSHGLKSSRNIEIKYLSPSFYSIFSCMYFSYRSSRPEVFLVTCVLKICSKFTGEQPCWSVVSIKLHSSFIETTLRHDCSPVNLLHIFRTPFPKKTYRWLLLYLIHTSCLSTFEEMNRVITNNNSNGRGCKDIASKKIFLLTTFIQFVHNC